MKTILSKPFLLCILAAGSLLLPACTTTKPSATTVSLLGAAGFRVRTPDTPRKKEIFAKLPGYKIEGIVVDGRKFYVYKDAARGMALVGGETEYERYRQMARQERLLSSRETAIMANAAAVETWHGASGSDWWQ